MIIVKITAKKDARVTRRQPCWIFIIGFAPKMNHHSDLIRETWSKPYPFIVFHSPLLKITRFLLDHFLSWFISASVRNESFWKYPHIYDKRFQISRRTKVSRASLQKNMTVAMRLSHNEIRIFIFGSFWTRGLYALEK